MATRHGSVGFIGLGAMGRPMCTRLLAAGREVIAFDISADKLEACRKLGAVAAGSAAEAAAAEFVFTSLPGSAFVSVAETALLPLAGPGQVFVDTGTVRPSETVRLAALFAARGASLLDCPVSGGPGGAERGELYVFAAGDLSAFERARPLLEVLGRGRVTYCGGPGSGQVVKGVNQLMLGLGAAAYLEAMAFGVAHGVEPRVIRDAIGSEGAWRADFHRIASQVAAGDGAQVPIKMHQFDIWLQAAREVGCPMPITEALATFCRDAPKVFHEHDRDVPSFWRELTSRTLLPR